MSERMNKERTKEVLEQIKNEKVEYLTIEDIQEPESEDIPRLQKQIKALDIAIDSLDNEWVDVRDRLPSENCNVLVTVFNKHFNSYKVEYMWFDKDENIFDYELEYEDFSMYDDEDVIAWKPLPQPYERKE